MVDKLLRSNANLNASSAHYVGRTALQAAAGEDPDTVDRLLQAAANINTPASAHSGRTALQAAAEANHMDMVNKLLQANANINAPAACRADFECGHHVVLG